MRPPREELPTWVAERDDNHGKERKDKATSDAGNQQRVSGTTWSFSLVCMKDRPGRKSAKKAVH